MGRSVAALWSAVLTVVVAAAAAGPIKVHPGNPHVFLWRGKSAVLVASTEHYGAVLNADFDYRRYLESIHRDGLNYTRIFSGIYSEPWGEPWNTLNPPKGRLICPWARSETPGYADGGNKFDLNRWDEAYFRRLKDFLLETGKRGIIVELTLFCNWYDDNQWRLSPLHASNNVNGVGGIPWQQVNTLRAGDALKHQEAMVRKIVTEVNGFDNLFFEICNEPGAEPPWMDHMARLIYDTESRLPKRHLIANNDHATPHLSILNRHYDRDLSFIRSNYGRRIVVGYDETGGEGAADRTYRRQGWRFLLAGGGLYDNLDWSFSVAHPDGTETQWNKDLGGGSPALRKQLGILLAFMNGLELPSMAPDSRILRRAPEGSVALSAPGWQTAVYLDGETKDPVTLDLPAGPYKGNWLDTKTGKIVKNEEFRHAGGAISLAPPGYVEDIALKIWRSDGRRPAAARAQPPPKKPAGLFRAINLGGGALVIDGVPWEAGHAGIVSFEGSAFENQKVPLNPPAAGARADMIRSSIWDPRGSNLTLTGVPPGDYEVYLTVWEDNDSQTFDIALNGVTVRKAYASGSAGHWERLGPWRATVKDETISLRTTGGHANLSGIEVWRRGAEAKPITNPKPPARAVSRDTDIRVSRNGRYLERHNGKPFFWLGDTAWLLSQMTTREDVDLYLRVRAEQGFTVIQAAAVMGEERVGGTLRPNKYGAQAFIDGNPAQPDLAGGYWSHLDYVIERARARRLILGILPLFVGWQGDGYKYLKPTNAYAYGHYLGKRYGKQKHIFWILGGDNVPDTEEKRKVWHEVARGITVGTAGTEDYGRTMMTYHISGGSSSSQWFHDAPWLDFNMAQVWGSEKDIPDRLAADYAKTPPKPMGLGEGSYENGPQYPTRPIDALKIRRQAYWSYLSGGYHTYGNTDVWNFSSYKQEATQDWKQALRSPGAASLTALARIMESAKWWDLAPDDSIFEGGPGAGDTRNIAARSSKADRILIYVAAPGTVRVRLDRLTGPRIRATWTDPRTTIRTPAAALEATGIHAFTTPPNWPDALLMLETYR